AATALAALGFAVKRLSALFFAKLFSICIGLAGLLLAAFPRMDQPWLDALENAAPAVQEAFLTSGERATRRDSAESIAAASAELTRLRALGHVDDEQHQHRAVERAVERRIPVAESEAQPFGEQQRERRSDRRPEHHEHAAGDRPEHHLQADADAGHRVGVDVELVLGVEH